MGLCLMHYGFRWYEGESATEEEDGRPAFDIDAGVESRSQERQDL